MTEHSGLLGVGGERGGGEAGEAVGAAEQQIIQGLEVKPRSLDFILGVVKS